MRGLRLTNVAASYESASGAVEVFRDVCFSVEPGRVLGVFGPNGCGKTTLLRMIAGLKVPANGEIVGPEDKSGHAVAMIPQDYRASFFDWASLQTNLELTYSHDSPKNVAGMREVLTKIRQDLEIDIDLRLRPSECSGGMLQQAAIIRAFENAPRLILADEPFSALDFRVAARIRSRFAGAVRASGAVAVLVLHQIQDLTEVCDEVMVVPGRPFSMTRREGYEFSRILKNYNGVLLTPTRSSEHFVAMAERVLGPVSPESKG